MQPKTAFNAHAPPNSVGLTDERTQDKTIMQTPLQLSVQARKCSARAQRHFARRSAFLKTSQQAFSTRQRHTCETGGGTQCSSCPALVTEAGPSAVLFAAASSFSPTALLARFLFGPAVPAPRCRLASAILRGNTRVRTTSAARRKPLCRPPPLYGFQNHSAVPSPLYGFQSQARTRWLLRRVVKPSIRPMRFSVLIGPLLQAGMTGLSVVWCVRRGPLCFLRDGS